MIGTTAAALLAASAAGGVASGLIGKGGADAAAAGANNASLNAQNRAINQEKQNISNASPYTSLGIGAAGQLGALLGYGSLWNHGGEGATYNFETDPTAQGRAADELNAFRTSTNAAVPTFNPVNAVSDTFSADPSYAWRVGQGNAALDRSAAAKGMLLSGAQTKALSDYNQGAASQEYGNWWNRYMAQNAYNTAGTQQQYANTEAQYNNAYNALASTLGLGNMAQSNLAGTDSGVGANANNALMSGAQAAGNATMAGANDLASGIGSSINNALLGSYLFRNGGGGASGYGAAQGNIGQAGSFGANWRP